MNGCDGFWWIIETVHLVDEPSDTMAQLTYKASDRFTAISTLVKATKIWRELEVVFHIEKSQNEIATPFGLAMTTFAISNVSRFILF